jgi:hypothetical protein
VPTTEATVTTAEPAVTEASFRRHRIEVDVDHDVVVHAIGPSNIEAVASAPEENPSPATVSDIKPIPGPFFVEGALMTGASKESSPVIVPATVDTATKADCCRRRPRGEAQVTDETDVHDVVSHWESPMDAVWVQEESPKFKPESVIAGCPDTGVLSGLSTVRTGASKLRLPAAVPTDAATVSAAPRKVDGRPSGDAQLTRVAVDHEVVRHADHPSCEVAVDSAGPRFRPTMSTYCWPTVGKLAMDDDTAGASYEIWDCKEPTAPAAVAADTAIVVLSLAPTPGEGLQETEVDEDQLSVVHILLPIQRLAVPSIERNERPLIVSKRPAETQKLLEDREDRIGASKDSPTCSVPTLADTVIDPGALP